MSSSESVLGLLGATWAAGQLIGEIPLSCREDRRGDVGLSVMDEPTEELLALDQLADVGPSTAMIRVQTMPQPRVTAAGRRRYPPPVPGHPDAPTVLLPVVRIP